MASIKMNGLDELERDLKDMQITKTEEERILKKCGDIFVKKVKENTPVLTGYTKKSVKKKLVKENEGRAVEVSVNAWDAIFSEYGTSKNKAHVGFFENSIEDASEEVFNYVEKEIFKDEK